MNLFIIIINYSIFYQFQINTFQTLSVLMSTIKNTDWIDSRSLGKNCSNITIKNTGILYIKNVFKEDLKTYL